MKTEAHASPVKGKEMDAVGFREGKRERKERISQKIINPYFKRGHLSHNDNFGKKTQLQQGLTTGDCLFER